MTHFFKPLFLLLTLAILTLTSCAHRSCKKHCDRNSKCTDKECPMGKKYEEENENKEMDKDGMREEMSSEDADKNAYDQSKSMKKHCKPKHKKKKHKKHH